MTTPKLRDLSKPAFRMECPTGSPIDTRFYVGEEDVTNALSVAKAVTVIAPDRIVTVYLELNLPALSAGDACPKLSREAIEALAEANGYTVSPIADGEPTP